MWWSESSIKDRNLKLKIDDPHWVIIKLEKIDSSDFETDLVSLQKNLDNWMKYCRNYEDVKIDHTYNYHCQEQYEYFISGVRKEYPEETSARLEKLKADEQEAFKKEEEKKEADLIKKRELLIKLKKELGEDHD